MKKIVEKSRFPLLYFEYAYGVKVEDYVLSRVNKNWTDEQIAAEMSGIIQQALLVKKLPKELLRVLPGNVNRWRRIMQLKGKGKRGVKPRLKPEQIKAIRGSSAKLAALADEFKVHASVISRIRHNKIYREVKE